jgi:transcriptional regulator with XRE-family HTH domain
MSILSCYWDEEAINFFMEKTIGTNLRKYRLERRLTLQALSKLCGVKGVTLSSIEHGRIQTPSFKNLERIAGALAIPREALFEKPDEPAPFYKGDLKGSVRFEFKKEGLSLLSYTPLLKELFIGKGVLKPKKTFDLKQFPSLTFLFLEVIFGKLEVAWEGRRLLLAEGENLSLRCPGKKSVLNPFQMRETSFLVVATPSLISANLESQKLSS